MKPHYRVPGWLAVACILVYGILVLMLFKGGC